MSMQITTTSNVSKELKRLAIQIRPAEDRVLALSHFNTEYEACGGDLNKMDPETVSATMHATGIDSLTMLSKGYKGDDRTFVLSVTEQFIEEYDCKGASEKATAQLAARAFTNIMVLSPKLNKISESHDLAREEVNRYNLLSKELDRSNTQYTQSIKLLRSLKQPNITVNIKAKEAYIAHNQQVNHGAK